MPPEKKPDLRTQQRVTRATGTRLAKQFVKARFEHTYATLTPAEVQTDKLVRAGLSRAAIAQQLGVAYNTVTVRMKMIREKRAAVREDP
jgi:DNA-binding CsgD family transcriptional regulator